MTAHWDEWVTAELIAELATREVEIVRLPIGDWTFEPYGPYIGCMDGAKEKISWFVDQCAANGIKVLIDVHAMKDSQNGFDNSGISNKTTWTDENNFTHWDQAYGEWMGTWNNDLGKYDNINWLNIQWGINVSNNIILEWGAHEALYAIEPLNEPWWSSDLDVLKTYYR